MSARVAALFPGAKITSGYRTPEHNRQVGGVPNSYHTRDEAVDFVPPPGVGLGQIKAAFAQSGLPTTELLDEHDHIHWAAAGGSSMPSGADIFADTPQPQSGPGRAGSGADIFADRDPHAPTYTGTTLPITRGQQKTLAVQRPDPSAPEGSAKNPRWQMYPGDKPASGTYIDVNGNTVAPETEPLWKTLMLTIGRSLPGGSVLPESERLRAAREAATSGLLLGGKNELLAGASAIPSMAEGGWQSAKDTFGKNLGILDTQDHALRENYPNTYNASAIGGSLAGGVLAPELAPGKAALAMDAGVGAAGGFLSTDGGLKQRGIGALEGGVGGALVGRALRGAAPKPVTDQRLLLDQGIRLTPGQMAGGWLQRAEDAIQGTLPVFGDAIQAAKVRGLKDFDRVALNRALEPINETLPKNVDVGREGLDRVAQTISDHYTRALAPVRLTPNNQLGHDLNQVLSTPNLPKGQRAELQTFVQDVADRWGPGIDGAAWKAIDSDINTAIRNATDTPSGSPSQRRLAEALRQVREAHWKPLEQTAPEVATEVKSADQATANLVRLRKASQFIGTEARAGVFTPSELNRAVQATDTSAGNRDYATGRALMQDIAGPAVRVLPSTVPNSGTPLRLFVGGSALTAANMSHDPTAVLAGILGTGSGAAAYSGPSVAAANWLARYAPPAIRAGRKSLPEMVRDRALAPRLAGSMPALLQIGQ